MEIPFIKIEGLGNDYIYIDERSIRRANVGISTIARLISDRHFGVGSDGLIIIRNLSATSAFMAIYNSDGSEAKFCGNGLRGTALYLKIVNRGRAKKYNVSTRWREYQVELAGSFGKSAIVKASMGPPLFEAKAVGLNSRLKTGLGINYGSAPNTFDLYCLALPNPHAVVFVKNFDFDWQSVGAEIENSPLFSHGTNIMFARVLSPKRIEVKPWERGSGATLACGSGAAAATVISNLLGYTRGPVRTLMPGGSLTTYWDIENNTVYQEGPSRIAFSGTYNL